MKRRFILATLIATCLSPHKTDTGGEDPATLKRQIAELKTQAHAALAESTNEQSPIRQIKLEEDARFFEKKAKELEAYLAIVETTPVTPPVTPTIVESIPEELISSPVIESPMGEGAEGEPLEPSLAPKQAAEEDVFMNFLAEERRKNIDIAREWAPDLITGDEVSDAILGETINEMLALNDQKRVNAYIEGLHRQQRLDQREREERDLLLAQVMSTAMDPEEAQKFFTKHYNRIVLRINQGQDIQTAMAEVREEVARENKAALERDLHERAFEEQVMKEERWKREFEEGQAILTQMEQQKIEAQKLQAQIAQLESKLLTYDPQSGMATQIKHYLEKSRDELSKLQAELPAEIFPVAELEELKKAKAAEEEERFAAFQLKEERQKEIVEINKKIQGIKRKIELGRKGSSKKYKVALPELEELFTRLEKELASLQKSK